LATTGYAVPQKVKILMTSTVFHETRDIRLLYNEPENTSGVTTVVAVMNDRGSCVVFTV